MQMICTHDIERRGRWHRESMGGTDRQMDREKEGDGEKCYFFPFSR